MVALDALTALSLDQQQKDVYTTPDQLSEELVTLTLLPRSKWQTLLNLETITVCSSLCLVGPTSPDASNVYSPPFWLH